MGTESAQVKPVSVPGQGLGFRRLTYRSWPAIHDNSGCKVRILVYQLPISVQTILGLNSLGLIGDSNPGLTVVLPV